MRKMRDLLNNPSTFRRFLLLSVSAALIGMLWHTLDKLVFTDTGGRPLSDRKRTFQVTIPCRACDEMALWKWGFVFRCPHCECEFEHRENTPTLPGIGR